MDMSSYAQRLSGPAPVRKHDAARHSGRSQSELSPADRPAAAADTLAQLRQTIHRSPVVQAQFALQRMLNARGPDVVQLAKLNLRNNGTISGVSKFPKRPSSNVSGSQGQHLTAYVSYEQMILSHVRDRTVPQAANALIDVLDRIAELPGGAYWYQQYGDTVEINKQLLKDAAKNDDAATVGDVIDNILSLRNKMPDTAIATAEQTWGHGEAKSAGNLEALEDILRTSGGTLPQQYDAKIESNAALQNMWRLLDYQPPTNASTAGYEKTKKRVLTHVKQMRLSFPQVFSWLSLIGAWLMPYIKTHRGDTGMPLSELDNTEIDDITKHVHGNL